MAPRPMDRSWVFGGDGGGGGCWLINDHMTIIIMNMYEYIEHVVLLDKVIPVYHSLTFNFILKTTWNCSELLT